MRALLAVTDVRVRIKAHIWRVVRRRLREMRENGIDTRQCRVSDPMSFAEGTDA